jgi:hypothetical protein
MPVIPVNRVVDPKRIIRKMEGQGGGDAKGVADPKKVLDETLRPVSLGLILDPSLQTSIITIEKNSHQRRKVSVCWSRFASTMFRNKAEMILLLLLFTAIIFYSTYAPKFLGSRIVGLGKPIFWMKLRVAAQRV